MPLTLQDRDAIYKEMQDADLAGHTDKVNELANYLAKFSGKNPTSANTSAAEPSYGEARPIKSVTEGLPETNKLFDPATGQVTHEGAAKQLNKLYGPGEDAQNLAARGVDLTTGAPAGNVKASFSPNVESRIKVYQDSLSKHFGQPVDVITDRGHLLYKNPQTGLMTAIADSSFKGVSQGPGALAGSAIPLATSTAGSMIPVPVVGQLGGAALGASVGEAARLGIGKMVGADSAANTVINDKESVSSPYTNLQIAKDAGIAGADTAASMALPLIGMRMPGLISLFFKGVRPIDPKFGQQLLNEASQSQQLVDRVKALGPGAEAFNPSVAQMSGNKDALRLQDALVGDAKYNRDFTNQMDATQGALKAGFNNTVNPGINPNLPGVSGAQSTLDGIQLAQADKMARVDEYMKDAQGELGVIIKGLPTVTRAQLADAVGPAIQRAHSTNIEATRQAFSAMDMAASLSPPIPAEAFALPEARAWRDSISQLRNRASSALTAKERQAMQGMSPDLPNPVQGADMLLMKQLGVPPNFEEGMPITALNDHIKFLNQAIRDSADGKATAGTNITTLYTMKDAATQFRAAWLRDNNPKLLNDIESAEALSTKEHEFQNKMIAYGFMKPANQATGLDPRTQMLAGILNNGDKNAAKQLMEAIDGDPQAKSIAENFGLSYYKNMFSVKKDGTVGITPDRLDKFTRSKLETLQVLMSPEAQTAITRAGDLQGVVNANSVKLAQAQKAFQSSFEGKVSGMTAEEMTNGVFSGQLGIEDVKKLKKIAQDLGTYDATSSAMFTKVRDAVVGADGKAWTPQTLDKMVNDSQMANRLTAWFGADTLNQLKTVNDGLKLSTMTSDLPAGKFSERSFYTDLARTLYAKPLTAEGRALTLLTGMRKQAYARAISEGLGSQEGLDKLVTLSKLRQDSNQAMATAAALKASLTAGPDYYGNVATKQDNRASK